MWVSDSASPPIRLFGAVRPIMSAISNAGLGSARRIEGGMYIQPG